MQKLLSEFLGTATLVIFGCGAVVLGGYGAQGAAGAVAIAFAFGLTVTAMIYAVGPVSGGHFNPAVSTAMLVAGRMNVRDYMQYVIVQVLGAIAGAAFLIVVLPYGGNDMAAIGLGQNSTSNYGVNASLLVEIFATFIFTTVILKVTGEKGVGNLAGLVIGLTLFVLIVTFLNVTGLSVNPARSFGPALFIGGAAMNEVWVFIVAPIIGAVLAGLVAKTKILG